ncbi:hypothetical protein NUW58_g469 [Xylaria curta]|uniref:Uncharacterized protein n=1 Tax=Xylaria curta TaxID=42375 RepID=A0ACC1PQA3_9PEZI|nr:hypothetical protein NUW58_g469 [Xylaria curta]
MKLGAWSNCTDDVPTTAADKLLGCLDITDLKHSVLRAPYKGRSAESQSSGRLTDLGSTMNSTHVQAPSQASGSDRLEMAEAKISNGATLGMDEDDALFFTDRSPIPETSGKVYKIAEAAELRSVLSSTTYVVVDFYADWCPPCRAIAPIFSKLADDHASNGQLAFAKVNVDHVKNIAAQYNVTAMPTFMFFQNGVPKGVDVEGLRSRQSVVLTDDGLVEKVRGADKPALEAVVHALARKIGGVKG